MALPSLAAQRLEIRLKKKKKRKEKKRKKETRDPFLRHRAFVVAGRYSRAKRLDLHTLLGDLWYDSRDRDEIFMLLDQMTIRSNLLSVINSVCIRWRLENASREDKYYFNS